MPKINLKLNKFAQKANKSLSEIARETGLNRNTVNALFHNQVDGIKFDTIEKLHMTYGLKLENIMEIREDKKEEPKWYTQEGEILPFYAWPGLMSIEDLPDGYFREKFGSWYVYAKGNHLTGYWDENSMTKTARWVFEEYGSKNQLNRLFKIYEGHARQLQNLYFNSDPELLARLDDKELADYFSQVRLAFKKFWQFSIFLDGFDPGYDQKKIKAIAVEHGLGQDEIAGLTTPDTLTFNNERLLEILLIAKKISKKKANAKSPDTLRRLIATDPQIAAYRKKFDYYRSSYGVIDHITDQDIADEISKYIKDEKVLRAELERLENWSTDNKKKVKEILRKHRLTENPLRFFQKLTEWREDRKKTNLMGIHVLDDVINIVEARTGIPKKYLQYLTHDELDMALKGLVNLETLKQRREEGMAVFFSNKSYRLFTGPEALSIKADLDKKIKAERQDITILSGQVASRGYAKGIARVIHNQKDFSKLRENEILVTGMTRPDFLPVMKLAAAFVTNEGGITCHAAIISRELGKPCIIGTRVATDVIRDGDLIEVRANHGTVRILSRQ